MKSTDEVFNASFGQRGVLNFILLFLVVLSLAELIPQPEIRVVKRFAVRIIDANLLVSTQPSGYGVVFEHVKVLTYLVLTHLEELLQ